MVVVHFINSLLVRVLTRLLYPSSQGSLDSEKVQFLVRQIKTRMLTFSRIFLISRRKGENIYFINSQVPSLTEQAAYVEKPPPLSRPCVETTEGTRAYGEGVDWTALHSRLIYSFLSVQRTYNFNVL